MSLKSFVTNPAFRETRLSIISSKQDVRVQRGPKGSFGGGKSPKDSYGGGKFSNTVLIISNWFSNY